MQQRTNLHQEIGLLKMWLLIKSKYDTSYMRERKSSINFYFYNFYILADVFVKSSDNFFLFKEKRQMQKYYLNLFNNHECDVSI